MTTDPSPVGRLMRIGNPRRFPKWPNYLKYGLTEEHIPDLINMATDPELNKANAESSAVWAPLHAWRALGQLRAEQAIEPLIGLLDLDDDWVSDELPTVFGMIGNKAIPGLAEYLADESRGLYPRTCAASALEKIANAHPETRNACLRVLVTQLAWFSENDPTLNGFLIDSLIDVQGQESMPTIREAFEADAVDLSIAGDLEDVEILMGLRQERSTPTPNYAKYTPELAELSEVFDLLPEKSQAEQKPKSRKLGRNEPCPCGSGKKYKKYCLGKM